MDEPIKVNEFEEMQDKVGKETQDDISGEELKLFNQRRPMAKLVD